MIRLALGLVVVVLLIVGVGMIVLGTFPPAPKTEQVQRVLPNDKFVPR